MAAEYKKGAGGERVHRIVAGAVGKGYNTIVDHKNGVKSDNRRSNLKVMSRAQHAVKTHKKYAYVRKCPICGRAYRPTATHRDGSVKTCGSKVCASKMMSRSAKRRGR